MSNCDQWAESITPLELQDQIDTQSNPLLIDTRSQAEFKAGRIPGAMNVPFLQSWDSYPILVSDKSQAILVYCARGPRAFFALSRMLKAGYTNICHLEGDMTAWRELGLAEER